MDTSPVRTPDARRINRLLSPIPLDTEEDLEFSQAMELSRIAYREEKKKLEQEEKEKDRLRTCLALPLSRLRLWGKITSSPREKEFLNFIIRRVEHRLYNDLDRMPVLPYSLQNEFTYFLENSIPPSYVEIKQICMECTHSHYSSSPNSK